MDCETIRPKLMALLDGELGDDPRRACESHLERCAVCAQTLAEFQAIRDAPPAPSETFDVWEAVQAQIEPEMLTQALLAEMRLMREEMRSLSAEVSELRLALKQAPPSPARSTALDLPYVRKSTRSPFHLV
ncbi:hypothetical protein CCAX7_30500 [Capsulimonas corticalis]|uniref:Uncharacterized protein n=2 Tax=Capsulimonas corticalis TaxID=2219043 RepID=A0A402CSR4_9BACT|nr:hypothetical protein CCAX7_30500 [Capsulimonas corticalis]